MTNNTIHRRFPLFLCGKYTTSAIECDLLAHRVLPHLEERCGCEGMSLAASDVTMIAARYPKRELVGACIDDIRSRGCYMIGIIGAGADMPVNGAVSSRPYPWQVPENIPALSARELDLIESVFANPFLGSRCFIYVHESLYRRHPSLAPVCSNPRLRRLLQALADSPGAATVQLYGDSDHLSTLACNDIGMVVESTARAIRDDIGAFIAEETAAHDAFAASRRLTYVPIGSYAQQIGTLVEQTDNDSRRIAIIGDSGAGKSAFLADYSPKIRNRYQDRGALVIEHYVGASPNGSTETAMLRHILAQLRQACPTINEPLPHELDAMVEALHTWPPHAGNRDVILVLDGLDRLSVSSNGLEWLASPSLPANLVLVISTQPHGDAYAELTKPLWACIEMAPLTMDDRWRLMNHYLDNNASRLPEWLKKQVLKSDAVTTPLFLRVVIEGIFIEGISPDTEARLQELLSVPSVDALFNMILGRLETDPAFDKEMVRSLLCLLHVSRVGLSLGELEDLLDPARRRRGHRQAESKRTLAVRALVERLGPFLVSPNGLLKFFHDSLGDVVERRYMESFGLKRIRHEKLASYFAALPPEEQRWQEVPWHLYKAGRREKLKKCLSAIPMFMRLGTDEYRWSLLMYWDAIKADNSLADTYLKALNELEPPMSPEETLQVLQHLGEMFLHAALYDGAEKILELAIPYTGNVSITLYLQLLLAEVYHQGGKLAKAEPLLVALTEHVVSRPDEEALVLEARERLARLYCALHDYPRAEKVLNTALQLSAKRYEENHPQNLSLLTLMGLVAMHRGTLYAAEQMFRQVLRACKAVYPPPYPSIAAALGNLAAALQKHGKERWPEAMDLVRQAVEINEKIYPAGHPETAYKLINVACMLRLSGYYEEAETACRRALDILSNVRDAGHQDVAVCLNNLGTLYTVMGRFAEAESAYREALAIYLRNFECNCLPVISQKLNIAWLQMRRGDGGDTGCDDLLAAAETFASMIPLKADILGFHHDSTARTIKNFRAAVEALRSQNPENERVLDVCVKLAEIEMQIGNYGAVVELLAAILPYPARVPGIDHPKTLHARELYEKARGLMGDDPPSPPAGE